MKSITGRLNSIPSKEKAFEWIKLITYTGGAQIIIQVVGFITGILIIRLLPTQEYGLYTLANTMLGTMTILADGGVSSGVMSQGGKVWKDREKLGSVLATGLNLRRKFAIASLLVSTPVLIYLLIHNGASWVSALLIVASLVPAFYAALSDSLLEIVPKLQQAILPLQKNLVTVGVLRLILSGITVFAFPWTFVAILASSIPRIYGNIKLRKIVYRHVDEHQLPDPDIRNEILKVVKRLLPLSIYYTVSGQITIWLLSLFGNTTSIGQMGALGRFAVILSLFSTVFSDLVIPRFARLKMEKDIIIKKYIHINILLAASLLIILLFVYLFRDQFLWLLGKQYAALGSEFIWVMFAGCLNLIVGTNFALLVSRGWIMHPIVGIPIGMLTIAFGAILINVSTLRGAIYYNLFLGVCSLVNVHTYFIYSIHFNAKRD